VESLKLSADTLRQSLVGEPERFPIADSAGAVEDTVVAFVLVADYAAMEGVVVAFLSVADSAAAVQSVTGAAVEIVVLVICANLRCRSFVELLVYQIIRSSNHRHRHHSSIGRFASWDYEFRCRCRCRFRL